MFNRDGQHVVIKIIGHMLCEHRDIFLKKVFHKPIIKPLFRYRESEIVEEILRKLKPQRCLEWGTGYSTLYYPKYLNENAIWISIDHDIEWVKRIKRLNQNPKVEIFWVSPNNLPWTDEYRDGNYSDLKDYIDFPSKFGKFDFILIDGRARKHCLIKAHELIKNDGVVVLHDANRKYYHGLFLLYKHRILFEDSRKNDGGLMVGTIDLDINTIFDLDTHRKLWCYVQKLGSFGVALRL